jgi:hypothetical protein
MTMRQVYEITERDIKKAQRNREAAEARLAYIEQNADKLRRQRKYGLMKAEATRQLLKGDPEYIRGIWQGRIDAAREQSYGDERPNKAFNMGYHEGYVNYKRDLCGGMTIPVEYLS